MKRKYIILASVAMLASPALAQETYQSAALATENLNGTARYVGMGGAMEALGADISTISSNPAGIGLFRKSQASVSGGVVFQDDVNRHPALGMNFTKGDKTNASFDQIGLVWAIRTWQKSFLNLAFNYHKSANFDQIITAGAPLSKASQNKLTAMKDRAIANGYVSKYSWSGIDDNYRAVMNTTTDGNSNTVMDYLDGTGYAFGQYRHGYIGEYDFNVSGNINNRVYLGVTVGIHDVNYRGDSWYAEDLEGNKFSDAYEWVDIDGSGFDVKAGAIFRPMEYSPFRVGVYINSPVMYDLTIHSRGALAMTYYDESGQPVTVQPKGGDATAGYDFRLNTPWRFGVSVGHTIDNILALGLTYEYSDYSAIDNRFDDGVDYYGDNTSSSDRIMNDNTDYSLKGVSTLKVGLEAKPVKGLSVRAGYNYVSPKYRQSGYRDGTIPSPTEDMRYDMSTDYTNWKSTNRLTFGLGYAFKNFNIDLAYQYTTTDGVFHPFMDYYDDSNSEYNNVATASKVNFKRNQLLMTLGYRF